jgi:hypothetical protein
MNNVFTYYRDWFHTFYQENPEFMPDPLEEAHKEMEHNRLKDNEEDGLAEVEK